MALGRQMQCGLTLNLYLPPPLKFLAPFSNTSHFSLAFGTFYITEAHTFHVCKHTNTILADTKPGIALVKDKSKVAIVLLASLSLVNWAVQKIL